MTVCSQKVDQKTEIVMAKIYTFTIKHYPTNDLLALDLQEHLNQMARAKWELVSSNQLVNEHSSTTEQIMLFWGMDE